jgi:GAF domain-containing protein
VSSSLELVPMLQGVVDLATEVTRCHACFIYLLEESELVIRAASPVFAEAVGNVRFSVHEGLAGWVARHRRPEFIRDRAMQDPRMKYVPLLEEDSFQSMAAVPILSRAGETIGVIVLHTRAPHEFGEEIPNLLTHIASLVSGAIENAQLYDRERRRVDSLTGLSELAQQVAAAPDAVQLGEVLVRGTAALLDAEACQLLRVEADGETVVTLASHPESLPAPALTKVAEVMLAGLEHRSGPGRRAGGRALWPAEDLADVLVTPLAAGGDRVGVLCVASAQPRAFAGEDAEIARAIAHLAAVAIKRAELIEGLTKANTIKDLFEALAAGDLRRRQGRRGALRSQRPVRRALGAASRFSRAVHRRVAGCRRGGGPGAVRAGAALGDRVRARPGASAAHLRRDAPGSDRRASA